MVCLELHPPRLCATSCSIFAVILLHLILFLLLINSLPYSPALYFHYHKWNLCSGRWGITIHRRIKKHTLKKHWHSRMEPIFVVYQMFALQLSSIVYCTLCYRSLLPPIPVLKFNHDTNQEISHDQIEDPGECTVSSNINEDNFDHQYKVLHQGQVRLDK